MSRRTRTILRNVALSPLVLISRIPMLVIILLAWACLHVGEGALRAMRALNRAEEWLEDWAPEFCPVPPKADPNAEWHRVLAKSFGTDAYNGPFAD